MEGFNISGTAAIPQIRWWRAVPERRDQVNRRYGWSKHGLDTGPVRLLKGRRDRMTIVDMPSFQFVEQRFVTDVQAASCLFTVPGGFLEDLQNKFAFCLLGGT